MCSGHRICTVCRLRGVDCVYPKTSERRRRRKGPQPTADIQIDEEEQEPPTQDLVGRVRELEDLLQRINELSNGIQFDPTLTTTNQRTLPGPDSDWQISKHLSLSDAFRTTCASLGLDPSRDLSLLGVDPDEILPMPFPELPSAQKRLDVCAERLGIYVPILDSDYSENGFLKKIALGLASEQSPVAMLHDDDFSQSTSQGWSFYCEGFRLIDRVAPKPYQLVDLAKFHLLRATYLLQARISQSAMEAISAAACLAIQAGLNDELSWVECSPDERMFRKRLWWSIYVMDRRVAEKCCKPYIIRDVEIAVDELEP
ncbi:hypothetical protein DM02DRAFT_631142 [Periconia macrospinosa]|uniref:Xylanolytic transcriptional activator regulatory domain-containing protein n=1 Tax=Periconia macrospinosa TaxID=97972 RepID=A0A2V1DHI8_9PLEO|nr:hypothetical protein DM02DRAFT_631142 [Periconia macrospinosa]